MNDTLLISRRVAESLGAEIRSIAPDLEQVVLDPEAAVAADLFERVTLAFFSGDLWPDHTRPFWRALFAAPHLRWLHSFSAGVDHPVFQRVREQGAIVTTSSGASAVQIAQTVALYLLMLSRDARGWLESQAAHRWKSHSNESLEGAVLGVLGLGPIGLEVARLGLALRMQVIGVRRSVSGDEPCETWTFERLSELLARVDWLVLALPLAEQTRHLLDAVALARMKPTARVINVGRGELIDEPALIEALAAGRLAGAALDVFQIEPLPEASPLWDLPNVIITPHNAGSDPNQFERTARIFLQNLRRWVAGGPLENLSG